MLHKFIEHSPNGHGSTGSTEAERHALPEATERSGLAEYYHSLPSAEMATVAHINVCNRNNPETLLMKSCCSKIWHIISM